MGFVDCMHCKLDVPCSILMTMLLYLFLVLSCINISSIKSRKQFCLIILRYLILHLAVFLTIMVLHSWTRNNHTSNVPISNTESKPNHNNGNNHNTYNRSIEHCTATARELMNNNGTSITLQLATSGIQTETQKDTTWNRLIHNF